MKHFYEHQDDSMRSKLTEHEFDMPQGAWENMTERLDALNQPSEAEAASWSAWFIIGAMLIATTVGLVVYQWQSPFGKTELMAEVEQDVKEESVDQEKNENKTAAAEKAETAVVLPTTTERPARKSNVGEDLPPSSTHSTAVEEELPAEQAQTVLTNVENDGEAQEVIEEELPEAAPNPDLNPDGQRPAALNSDKPVYTRKTIVTHAFSESTLKWRNNQLPTLSPKPAIEKAQARLLIDTPIIILENPYTIPQKNDWQYGVSGGVNTKVYGSNGNFSLAPVVGVFVRKQLDPQFAIQADLQYKNLRKQSIQDPFGNNKEAEMVFLNVVTENNTGGAPTYEERQGAVYEIKEMQMIELPISFLYQLNSKHQIGLGVKAAYLFGARSGHAEIDAMSQKDLGYNSLDLGALTSYEYQINDHFALGIVYSVGFLNLAKPATTLDAQYSDNWGGNYEFTTTQQSSLENTVGNEELMMPIRVTEDEQVFLKTPRNMYNSDLRILLRYFF